MVETRKERRLRFALIALFVSITAIALFYKYKEPVTSKEEPSPLAIVLQTDINENPNVILYDIRNDEHILAKYEVQLNNDYRFKTVEALKLKQPIKALVKDVENGVWAKIKNEWHYFDSNLIQGSRSHEYKATPDPYPFSEEKRKSGKWIILADNKKIRINEKEHVEQLHPLSINKDLWLLITNYGVKISTIDTK